MPDVTPDDDNDGVEVWRCAHDNFPTEFTNDSAMAREYGNQEPGRWFTTLRAEQLLADARFGRDVAKLLGIGLDRPPEAVFEHFRRVLELPAALDVLRPAAPGTPE